MTTLLDRLEAQISESKRLVDLNDSLNRLRSNPDFIKIIEEGYFKEAAIRLVTFAGSPSCIGDVRTDAFEEIQSIGRLRHYFAGIAQDAREAHQTIVDCNNEIDSLEVESEDDE